eukprot:scaffold14033_cov90-Isochrysis_galbana.AAC.2
MACYDVQASQCKRGSGIPVVAFSESSGWTAPPVLPLDLEKVINVATDADDIPAADIPEKGDTTAAVGRAGDELTEDLHQHKSVMSVSDMVKAFGRKPVGGLGAGIDFDSQEDPTAEVRLPHTTLRRTMRWRLVAEGPSAPTVACSSHVETAVGARLRWQRLTLHAAQLCSHRRRQLPPFHAPMRPEHPPPSRGAPAGLLPRGAGGPRGHGGPASPRHPRLH